jgi:RNase adapter protein RapZ
MSEASATRRVVLVSGLSGAGKLSILRTREDLGYETVDNPPLPLIEELVGRAERPLAIGVDVRSQGFRAEAVLGMLDRLRRNPSLRIELVYAVADRRTLLHRYSETRRRHPLAPEGRVVDAIAAEETLTAALRDACDLLVDTSELPAAELRRLIRQRFRPDDQSRGRGGLVVSVVSFAYPRGLPPDADLVFDTRFLRNPHYDPRLREQSGFDPEVGAHIEADPDYPTFYRAVTSLLGLVLPRFVQEGKQYATIAIGCTGGRHRSVYAAERIAEHLASAGWQVIRAHRELAAAGGVPEGAQPAVRMPRLAASAIQAQEA